MELYYTNRSLELIEGEIWLPVVGYETIYEVSNFGRVKSLPKSNCKKSIILNQFYNTNKYLCVNLHKDGKHKQVKVHRLVGQSFLPKSEKETINHIDGNKENNILSNLEWSSFLENNRHAWRIGLKKPSEYQKQRAREANSGINSWAAKLVLDLSNGVYYDTVFEAAKAMNMKRGTLSSMLRGVNRNKTTLKYV